MHHYRRLGVVVTLALLPACFGSMVVAAETDRSAEQWLRQFQKGWNEDAWVQPFRGQPAGYMRPKTDRGWKVRMRALQGLVARGKQAVPHLLKVLKTGETPQRILAAQALGYLAPHVPREALLKAARSDRDPAVRLYAVDSLGMQGETAETVDWKQLLQNESNRDVRKHIGYAIERKGKPLDPGVVRRLRKWAPGQLDSARVGQPAPDFELSTANGRTIRLSDYEGEKNVVLVFIYGDT